MTRLSEVERLLERLRALGGSSTFLGYVYLPTGRLTKAQQSELAVICYRLGVLTAKGKVLVTINREGSPCGWREK